MSIEADLATTIGPLVGDRVFPDDAPEDTPLPYATYQQIGGQPLNYLEGVPTEELGRFQINVWGDDREAVNALLRQIRGVLCVAPMWATVMTGLVARKEPLTKLYGAQQDFSILFKV
ncbi:DUF3168 domain-containing protein [Cupriavidus plantarum]|uniref:DUF3168 domain-containing protein n=1 Tax=Cupriavidus plantarum TaxID=942865 RepID=UPI000EB2F646|nr:DUF3168 domain-containing protein [Cupriavidus plantarum]RLK45948.1 uncharacterized protein DUF3168 [Cupriavidus plantarum]